MAFSYSVNSSPLWLSKHAEKCRPFPPPSHEYSPGFYLPFTNPGTARHQWSSEESLKIGTCSISTSRSACCLTDTRCGGNPCSGRHERWEVSLCEFISAFANGLTVNRGQRSSPCLHTRQSQRWGTEITGAGAHVSTDCQQTVSNNVRLSPQCSSPQAPEQRAARVQGVSWSSSCQTT